MNTSKILTGSVTEDSLRAVFDSAMEPESFRVKEDRALCPFPQSMRTPQFYGLSQLSFFPLIGLVGRLKYVKMEDGQEIFVPQPLEGKDAQAFESIVGLMPQEMDKILKDRTAR